MSCHAVLQGIFLTQGSNPRLLYLLHCQAVLLVPPGKPKMVNVLWWSVEEWPLKLSSKTQWLQFFKTFFFQHYGPGNTVVKNHRSITALFTIARTWKQPKCPSAEQWIYMWSIYTMEYYSAIAKEQNCVTCRDMDGPTDCHTHWTKSEREKQILDINAHMWNLGILYRGTHLPSRNRHRCGEQKYGYQGGKGEWDELGVT